VKEIISRTRNKNTTLYLIKKFIRYIIIKENTGETGYL
jgi:hypothetical protein